MVIADKFCNSDGYTFVELSPEQGLLRTQHTHRFGSAVSSCAYCQQIRATMLACALGRSEEGNAWPGGPTWISNSFAASLRKYTAWSPVVCQYDLRFYSRCTSMAVLPFSCGKSMCNMLSLRRAEIDNLSTLLRYQVPHRFQCKCH